MNTLGWLDFGAAEQRRAVQLLDSLRERDTVDELGLGAIRDAFAERLFPGTSTIQTRARYFLIVPWIYRSLEEKRVSAADIARRARAEEVRVIRSLAPLGQNQGVIGIDAQENLKRFPSSIYWFGLARWGIRLFQGSQRQYHASLDRYYERVKLLGQAREDDPAHEHVAPNWHIALPERPEDVEDLALPHHEAEYLLERIQYNANGSLLDVLCREDSPDAVVDFPWQHPGARRLHEELAEDLWHARNFSEVAWAATLLYHLVLARQAAEEGSGDVDLAAEKRDRLEYELDAALNSLRERAEELRGWNRMSFWFRPGLDLATGAASRTEHFLDVWLGLIAKALDGERLDSREAIRLISDREVSLKGALARVRNLDARTKWISQSDPAQMDYRWSATVRRLVRDIREGLAQ